MATEYKLPTVSLDVDNVVLRLMPERKIHYRDVVDATTFMIRGVHDTRYLVAVNIEDVTHVFLMAYQELLDLCIAARRWPTDMEIVRG